MLRKECTSKTLKETGWEEVPTSTNEYVTPLKDVAYYLREEGFDCKVELDTSTEYEKTRFPLNYEPFEVYYYNYEYMYIRPHGTSKWNKVARREVKTYGYSVNKNRD